MFLIIVNQILKMLLLLLLGFACYRMKLVDQNGNKMLANLLLMIVNPAVAVMALQTDYKPELVKGLLLSYLLAFVIHGVAAVLTTKLIRPDHASDCGIDRFCAMYSNCGFMGIPLVQSILGSEGVLYLTAYMTVFNIFSYTHGVAIMTGKASPKDLLKGVLSPMILSSLLGLFLFFMQLRFPVVIADTLDYVAGMNTPLAMMIAGISIAQVDLRQTITQKRLYLISAKKLLLMPALVLILLSLIHIPSVPACTILVASACPVAATGTAFSLKYQKNYKYASELYAFSTLASLVTVPLFVFAAEWLLMGS